MKNEYLRYDNRGILDINFINYTGRTFIQFKLKDENGEHNGYFQLPVDEIISVKNVGNQSIVIERFGDERDYVIYFDSKEMAGKVYDVIYDIVIKRDVDTD